MRLGAKLFQCCKAVLERDSIFYKADHWQRVFKTVTEALCRDLCQIERFKLVVYGLTDSPLGRLLVAVTERGVCRVAFGDSDLELVPALYQNYPSAQEIVSSRLLQSALEQIVEYLSGRSPRLDLPVDVQASAFQLRVWDELRRIPYGQTRNYSEIASAISLPKAVRAVARACASNPVALIYPCHRVLRKDGSLGGYAWGRERKKKLLEMEAMNAKD